MKIDYQIINKLKKYTGRQIQYDGRHEDIYSFFYYYLMDSEKGDYAFACKFLLSLTLAEKKFLLKDVMFGRGFITDILRLSEEEAAEKLNEIMVKDIIE